MFRFWRIGSIRGINLYLHGLLILVPAYLIYSSIRTGDTLEFACLKLLWMAAIFGCVLLHEFGHAYAASIFNIRTLDISLLPIGGIARLERATRVAWEEFWIAVAGPAVNLLLAAILFLVWRFGGDARLPRPLSLDGMDFVFFLMLGNMFLCIFNLIPAYPMDGGKIFRAMLGRVYDYDTATIVAGRLGQFIAGCYGIICILFFDWPMLIIAGIVFLAASFDIMMSKRRQWQHQALDIPSAENLGE